MKKKQKITKANILKSLNALGKNKKQVAIKLKKLNIKGYMGDAYYCPVANYLRGQYKIHTYGDVYVNAYDVTLKHLHIKTPEYILNFIEAFDKKKYKSLIAK